MHPNHPHFPILPHVCLLLSCDFWSPPKIKIKNKQTSPTFVILTLTGVWPNSQWPVPQVELSPSPPESPQESISCGEPSSASLPRFLKVFFYGFLFRLLPFIWWGGGGMGTGIVTEAGHAPPTVPTIMNTTAKIASSIFTVSGSLVHGLPHVFWRQNKPLLQWDPDKALGGSADHRH